MVYHTQGNFVQPQGTLGDGWRHFWSSPLGGKGGATGIWSVEARDTAQHPTVHSMTPDAENDLAPDVSGALMGTETDQGSRGHLGSECRKL